MRAVDFDVLVIAPFRRPTFRKAISPLYPVEEPWDSPPLVAAGGLRAAGFSVGYLPLQQIFDGWDDARDRSALAELLARHRARAVVFASDNNVASRSTASVHGIGVVAAMLAEASAPPVMALTGRLSTTAAEPVLAEIPGLDFAVIGEADGVLPHLLTLRLDSGPPAVADHPSVVSRHGAAGPRRAAQLARADDAPMPAWDLLPTAIPWYRAQHPGWDHPIPVSMRTSIGCVFECKFCAGIPNWRTYRTKSPSRVAAEVDGLREATGTSTRLAFLEDEIFTRTPGHAEAVASLFEERGLRVDGVYTHSRLLDEASATAIARMARRVLLGMDSAENETLQRMGKGQRVDHVLAAVDVARRAALLTHLEWIVGSPGETVDSLVTSLVAIFGLLSTGTVDSINTYVYCPHPGTAYARDPERFGLDVGGALADMQESGGFPAAELRSLSRNQVFSAYLMSQLLIAEVKLARQQAATAISPSWTALHRLFEQIAGASR